MGTGARPVPIFTLRKFLSRTLIVGDTLCLGGAGLLGGEGQHQQGDEVGQHAVEVGVDSDLGQEVDTVAGTADAAALKAAVEEAGYQVISIA